MTWTPLILWTPPIYIPLSNWLSWAAFSEIVGQNQLSQWSQIDFTRGITMKAGFVFFVLQEHSWEVFWAFLSAVIGQVMTKYVKEEMQQQLNWGRALSRCLLGYYVRRRSALRWLFCLAGSPTLAAEGKAKKPQGAGSASFHLKRPKIKNLICLFNLKRLKNQEV